jgi:hypothetical protein
MRFTKEFFLAKLAEPITGKFEVKAGSSVNVRNKYDFIRKDGVVFTVYIHNMADSTFKYPGSAKIGFINVNTKRLEYLSITKINKMFEKICLNQQ